ncbi:MAG: PIN domain-containing protein [Sphingomonas bacterium]
MKSDALLDTNVVVAMLIEAHEHHGASLALLTAGDGVRYAIAAHSYAEAYSTLTRLGANAPFQLTAEEAWAALESVRAVTALIGLTAPQSFEAIRGYAQGGGIGARLYDRLIGEAAVAHDIPTILTWNVRHMRGLFPGLSVLTPGEWGL